MCRIEWSMPWYMPHPYADSYAPPVDFPLILVPLTENDPNRTAGDLPNILARFFIQFRQLRLPLAERQTSKVSVGFAFGVTASVRLL